MRVVGKGSLVKKESKPDNRCRIWQSRYIVEANGEQAVRTRIHHGAKTACQKLHREFRAELEDEPDIESITVDAYVAQFMAWKDSTGRAAKTKQKYAHSFQALTMHLGGKRVSEVTPLDIEQTYMKLRNGFSPSGKRLSETTLQTYSTSWYSLFKRAVRDGACLKNPLDQVDDRPTSDTPERKALTRAQAVEFMASLNPAEPHHCLLYLCTALGTRRIEAVNISWDDISDGMLDISRSKTPKGYRTIPLREDVVNALQIRRFAQWEEFRMAGMEPADDELVAATPVCRHPSPETFGRWWRRHRAEFGMEDWTPHEFRHTFATLLAESGADPKLMAELLGHESELTSLRIYNHVHGERKVDAMEALGEYLK